MFRRAECVLRAQGDHDLCMALLQSRGELPGPRHVRIEQQGWEFLSSGQRRSHAGPAH
jgi:hypothetical protein